MKKFSISLGLGFIVNNLVGTLVAMFILAPLLNPLFGDTLRSELNMPSLLGGYFLQTLFMVIAFPFVTFSTNWVKQGLAWGALAGGLTFLSDHMITAGWSVLPVTPMIISGFIDILAPLATGLLIAYIYKNGK
jgi:hypothetical protein